MPIHGPVGAGFAQGEGGGGGESRTVVLGALADFQGTGQSNGLRVVLSSPIASGAEGNSWTLRGRQRDEGVVAMAGALASYGSSTVADADDVSGSYGGIVGWDVPRSSSTRPSGSGNAGYAYYALNEERLRRATETTNVSISGDNYLWGTGATWASTNSDFFRYDASTGRFASDAAVLAYIIANVDHFDALYAAGRTKVAYFNTTSNTVRIAEYTPSTTNTYSGSSVADADDIVGNTQNLVGWDTPRNRSGRSFGGAPRYAYYALDNEQLRWASEIAGGVIASDSGLWGISGTWANTEPDTADGRYGAGTGRFANDAAALAYVNNNSDHFEALHAAGRTRLAYFNTTSNTVRIATFRLASPAPPEDAAPVSVEIDEENETVTVNYSPTATGAITTADTLGIIQTELEAIDGLDTDYFGGASDSTTAARAVSWNENFTSGLRVTINLGGYALGPPTNSFGTNSGTRSVAETSRDNYASANPSWLTAYEENSNFWIVLNYASNARFQYYNGTTWRDVSIALQGEDGRDLGNVGELTQAQAEDEVSTVYGVVSGERLYQAVVEHAADASAELTQAQAEDETSTVFGSVSGQRLYQAVVEHAVSASVSELTQAQAEDKTDTAFGTVSGERLEQAVIANVVVDIIDGHGGLPSIDDDGSDDLKLAVNNTGIYSVETFQVAGTPPTADFELYVSNQYRGAHDTLPQNPLTGQTFYHTVQHQWYHAVFSSGLGGELWISGGAPTGWIAGNYANSTEALNGIDQRIAAGATTGVVYSGNIVYSFSNFVAGTDVSTHRRWHLSGVLQGVAVNDYVESGAVDAATEELVLTLRNGGTVRIDVSDLFSGGTTAVELTQAQVEDETSTDFGSVSGERLEQAVTAFQAGRYKGIWSSAVDYARGDSVIISGRFYVAITNSTNQSPISSAGRDDWSLLRTGNEILHSPGNYYTPGMVVRNGGGADVFICRRNTSDVPSDLSPNWFHMPRGAVIVQAPAASTEYLSGTIVIADGVPFYCHSSAFSNADNDLTAAEIPGATDHFIRMGAYVLTQTQAEDGADTTQGYATGQRLKQSHDVANWLIGRFIQAGSDGFLPTDDATLVEANVGRLGIQLGGLYHIGEVAIQGNTDFAITWTRLLGSAGNNNYRGERNSTFPTNPQNGQYFYETSQHIFYEYVSGGWSTFQPSNWLGHFSTEDAADRAMQERGQLNDIAFYLFYVYQATAFTPASDSHTEYAWLPFITPEGDVHVASGVTDDAGHILLSMSEGTEVDIDASSLKVQGFLGGLPQPSIDNLDRLVIDLRSLGVFVCINSPHRTSVATGTFTNISQTNITITEEFPANFPTAVLDEWLYSTLYNSFYSGVEVAPGRVGWVQDVPDDALADSEDTSSNTAHWLGRAEDDAAALASLGSLASATEYFYYSTSLNTIRHLTNSTFSPAGSTVDHYNWAPIVGQDDYITGTSSRAYNSDSGEVIITFDRKHGGTLDVTLDLEQIVGAPATAEEMRAGTSTDIKRMTPEQIQTSIAGYNTRNQEVVAVGYGHYTVILYQDATGTAEPTAPPDPIDADGILRTAWGDWVTSEPNAAVASGSTRWRAVGGFEVDSDGSATNREWDIEAVQQVRYSADRETVTDTRITGGTNRSRFTSFRNTDGSWGPWLAIEDGTDGWVDFFGDIEAYGTSNDDSETQTYSPDIDLSNYHEIELQVRAFGRRLASTDWQPERWGACGIVRFRRLPEGWHESAGVGDSGDNLWLGSYKVTLDDVTGLSSAQIGDSPSGSTQAYANPQLPANVHAESEYPERRISFHFHLRGGSGVNALGGFRVDDYPSTWAYCILNVRFR